MDEKEIQKRNRHIAETYTNRIWNQKDYSAIDEYFLPDASIYTVLGYSKGKKFMKEMIQQWLTGFPSPVLKVIASAVENDFAFLHCEINAIHMGEFKGINATGKKINFKKVIIYRIENGKISEYWGYTDMLNILSQLS